MTGVFAADIEGCPVRVEVKRDGTLAFLEVVHFLESFCANFPLVLDVEQFERNLILCVGF